MFEIMKLVQEQNIQVTCEQEEDDFLYADGFENWEDAVNFFLDRGIEAVELEAV